MSQTADFHFANYRFSFRKLQILISQTTDFHFANYRFPFRFVPFRFANCSKPFFSDGLPAPGAFEKEKSPQRKNIYVNELKLIFL